MDHAEVSARAVAKVVLVAAAVARRALFRLPDPRRHRPLLDRRLLRGGDRPGGQLARPPTRSPLGGDLARLPRHRGEHLRDRLADRAAAGERRGGPLGRPPGLRRGPAQQRDVPRLRRPLPHHREAHPAGRGAAHQARRRRRHPARRHRRRLHALRAAVLDPGDHLLPGQGRAPDAEFFYRNCRPSGRASATDRRRHLRRDRRLRVRQLRDQRAGRPGHLRDPPDPRCAVRDPAGDPVRVLRPDPARRGDAWRDPGRDRGGVHRTSQSA